jgi:hypothetical protein
MATARLFISMGTPYTPQLSAFRAALETVLRERFGVDPRIMGKNEYPTGSPLPKIVEVMKSCDGVIVVANERTGPFWRSLSTRRCFTTTTPRTP